MADTLTTSDRVLSKHVACKHVMGLQFPSYSSPFIEEVKAETQVASLITGLVQSKENNHILACPAPSLFCGPGPSS